MNIENNIELAKKFFEISETSFETKSPWKLQQFIDFFNSDYNYHFEVVKEDKVVGFLLLTVVFETAELELIGIQNEYLRTGLGTSLLLEGIHFLKEKQVENLLLEVRKSNRKARLFYESQGFTPVGIRKNYYQLPTEDAILLEFKL